MAQLRPLFVAVSFFVGSSVFAQAPRLEPVAIARIPAKLEFRKTVVGGLSGLAFHDGEVLMVSDDRGKIDRPRFYRADLTVDPPKAELRLKSVHFLANVPGLRDGSAVLDPEGLARLADGTILISSEADTNRKPREKNRLMRFDANGAFLDEGEFPRDYQPNPSGRQTRGSPNNAGPEGLTVCPDGKIWTGMERPLRQEENTRKVRFLSWGNPTPLRPGPDKLYPIEAPADGGEIFRGVSEILCWGDDRFLVLERALSLQLGKPSRVYGGGLFYADCSKKTCEKTPLLDLARDLAKIRGDGFGANFEGLAFGPLLKDGSRTVLMISDDNFDSTDGTELIVLKILPALKRDDETEKK